MKKDISIKTRLLVPITAILFFQMACLVAFYQYGGVVPLLWNNATNIFTATTRHRQVNIERELTTYQQSVLQAADEFPDLVEQLLQSTGRTPQDIAADPELNRTITVQLVDHLIELLHYCHGNGAYLVLDGPASVNGDKAERAGVFIRDMDASSFQSDYSDLLLLRGSPSIVQQYRLALDSRWELGFSLEQMESDLFFQKPFQLAVDQKVPQRNAHGCAYLGMLTMDPAEQSPSLSYSVPLILSDGSVIGVVGVELSATRVRQLFEDGLDENNRTAISMLGISTGEEPEFLPVFATDSQLDTHFAPGQAIRYQPTGQRSLGLVHDLEGSTWYSAIEPLAVYTGNTPFSAERWSVVRLTRERSLFAELNAVQNIFLTSVAISLFFSLLILLLAGHVITSPIQKLMQEMRQTDWKHRLCLNKIHIREIDELVDEVNRLSVDVADRASKVSQILDALEVEIGVFEYTPGTDEVFCSDSLLRLLGSPYDTDEYQMMDRDRLWDVLSVLDNPSEDENGRIYEVRRDDGLHYVQMKLMSTESQGLIGVLMDVTAEVNEHRRLERERNDDHLTGLYNRRAFQEVVKPLLSDNRIELAAFVMWDMDNLKYVNDTYGHEIGDRYICMFAEHLRGLVQAGAIVERRSGDEFMAVLYGGTEAELRRRIHDFMEQLKQIILDTPDGCRIPLRASAGVSWYPMHSTVFEDLARYSDFAMYMSKHSNKGLVQEFDPESYQTNAYLLSGREELNQILEHGEVQFALQPIVTRVGDIYGYEVLMRPPLKKLKNISELLHLAKLQAKLPQFEELTWCQGLKWVAQRASALAEGARFFINSISNVYLNDKVIRRLEAEYADLMDRVVLELTETEEIDPLSLQTKKRISQRRGMQLALDDYGSGYNNEAALIRIEPSIVKMDLSLVRDIHTSPNQQTIARNLVAYCHPRDILVLAEGVETEEELDFLMELQVDLFQGYYIARPSIEPPVLSQQALDRMRDLAQR